MKTALSVVMSLGLVISQVTPNAQIPQLQLKNSNVNAIQTSHGANLKKADVTSIKDGINEGWAIDPVTAKTGEVNTIVNGALHLSSSVLDGNDAKNATRYPAVFVNPQKFDFNQPGFFSTKLTSLNGSANDRFGFYLGYKDPGNGLFIGYDASGWFWQKYQNGDGEWYKEGRVAGPSAGAEANVRIEWNENHQVKLIVDNQTIFDFSKLDFSKMTLTNKIAIKTGTYGQSLTDVKLIGMDYTGLNAPVGNYGITGTIKDEKGQPVQNARVSIGEESVLTDVSGNYIFGKKFPSTTYTLKVAKSGYQAYTKNITVANTDLAVDEITLSPVTVETDILQTADMNVQIYKSFPAVRKYEMTSMGNKVMWGAVNPVNTIQINGKDIALADSDVTFTKQDDTDATYVMKVKSDADNINAVICATLNVNLNTLNFNITKIENLAGDADHPIQTIAIPNHSVISVHSDQAGATFTGALMSSDTNKNGDETLAVTNDMSTMKNKDYMYGFISDNALSAGIWSNSEHDGRAVASVAAGGTNTRVYASTTEIDNYTSLGLASAPWYYTRVVKDSKGNSYHVPKTDMPKMSIAITDDANGDKTVNWEDGAIAFRSIMNNPYKSEEVPELVAYRIAMNFGSQAQNPFLTTLDNVKKVALNTDGLGQSVLLKGYANEGHDSGHPDYADIGKRIGGVKDFNMLMEKGKPYGARFGIHVNASEMYPEAKAFNEQMVRRDASGGLRYGWNWLDQAVGIDGIYDLASGSRDTRFANLKKEVNDNLDFVYVDVWGNRTSGNEDSWETRKLSNMITDKGWRMANEWGAANEYDSTFQHWAADLTYGGSTYKGQNSQVMRFLRNHQKDSWDGDYPSYGGAANAPLLGGYDMKDFEGWQGRNDYTAYINNLFTHDVSTKFIQHYKVTSWLNNPLDATAPKDASVNNGNEQIILKDDAGNTLVITRGTNDNTNPEYRKRTITWNGKVVLDGHVSKGDETGKGDESYLLPWNWDVQTGKPVASENEKLYHWNTAGGTTTWDLTGDWTTLSTVKVYQLTEEGKTNETSVPVKNGQITLEAKAETPYVVTKGNEDPMNVTWSEGMHIVDAGFNSGEAGLKKYWKIDGTGTASIKKSQFSNPMLKLSGDVETTQTLTDLTPGQEYAMYLGVDNRSDGKAYASISSNGKEIAENYATRSIAKNYVKAYTHNTNSATVDGSSYFQNMYVFFTAPKDGSKVALTLKHTGTKDAYYDDVRIVENNSKNIKLDEKGNLQSFTNDFEQNAQGIYPFVVSGAEGVEDNRIHLSEKHAPYTQAGWDVKKMDDVLDGDWSVKINGLVKDNTIVYQTIPQNIRFEPGATYNISFKYQAGSEGTYAVAVGSGEFGKGKVQLYPLHKALGKNGMYSFKLTGSLAGDSWFGIYSTAKEPDLQGTVGSASDFGGYKDFILDDLNVEKVQESFTKEQAQQKLDELTKKYVESDFNADTWKTYCDTLMHAKVLLNKNGTTPEDYQKAYGLLSALDTFMTMAPGNETSNYYDIRKDAYTIKAGSEQFGVVGEGEKEFAQDGNSNTWWHTDYGDKNLDNAWYEFDLTKPTTVDGLRYLPRTGADNANGKIKTYDIILTTANGITTRIAGKAAGVQTISGEFDLATKWQKKSFAPVDNVVSVRLKVNSSAGQTTSQENHFASAASLYITEPKAALVVPVEKTKLQAAMQSVASLQKDNYTPISWAVLENNLDAANTVMANTAATQYDVELATVNLQGAIASLVLASTVPIADKSALHTAIKDAQAVDTSKYTATSVDVFKKALDVAIAVQSNISATQNEIDSATTNLLDAHHGLKLIDNQKIDKASLLNKIAEALQLNKNAYTEGSYQALVKAIENAQRIIEDPNATQADLKQAYVALDKARKGLIPVKQTNDLATDKTITAVKTGDTTSVRLLFITFVVAGGVAYVILRKKSKNKGTGK